MRKHCLAVVGTGLALALIAGETADAAGYWNLPGSLCQCLGCGYGPGYHAPMMLGPASHAGWCDHRVERLPYPPTPYRAWHDCQGASCGAATSPLFQPTALPNSGTSLNGFGNSGPVLR